MTDLNIAVVRTSDRTLFKRCRRKWSIESGLKRGLRIKESPGYFWLGTGGHFALEDYHGYNYYGHPVEAFRAYHQACRKAADLNKLILPPDHEDLAELCEGILENYLDWCTIREPHPTFWYKGEPQVELKCSIPLTEAFPDLYHLIPEGYDDIHYTFQLDRVVEIDGELWITDYKFYKNFSQSDLDLDQQLSAYTWAASLLPYGDRITGAILHEFRKQVPNEPRVLKNGTLSTAKNQGTTHYLYRQALIEHFGTVDAAPLDHQECLTELGKKENEHGNAFIKRTPTRRTRPQLEAEGEKVRMELEEMLNPNLPLYPNPTRDCSWECPHREVCKLMDRDEDWETLLDSTTEEQEDYGDIWRDYLPE